MNDPGYISLDWAKYPLTEEERKRVLPDFMQHDRPLSEAPPVPKDFTVVRTRQRLFTEKERNGLPSMEVFLTMNPPTAEERWAGFLHQAMVQDMAAYLMLPGSLAHCVRPLDSRPIASETLKAIMASGATISSGPSTGKIVSHNGYQGPQLYLYYSRWYNRYEIGVYANEVPVGACCQGLVPEQSGTGKGGKMMPMVCYSKI